MANQSNVKQHFRGLLLALSLCAITCAQEQPGADANAPPSNAKPGSAVADPDPAWTTNLNLYLWFPGTHGIIGANGYDVGYKASAGDILSHFRFGLMGAVGAQHGRFVIIGDMVWVRLEANKQTATPLPGVPQITAQAKAGEFILTPEFGYRFFDGEKIKIDALGGVRYWHLESSLNLTPFVQTFGFSKSVNFADPLMGARFQVPLSRRLLVTILGDAGGWGAGSQLDWQLVGALGLRLSPKWTLNAGYRYLYVNYRPGSFVYESALSGALLGVTYTLK